jgi:hypothetical protein
MKNVDYVLLYAVAGAESSFRSDVGASTSSAVGLFQFTEGTWNELCRQYKLPYTPEDRKDPQKSAEVASLYIGSINTTLQRALGRKPTYGEVYMGYFLGPTGAANFLRALQKNPNAIGAEMFPKAAAANPGVFYDRGNRSQPLTLRQILAKQEGKIVSYAQDAEPNTPGNASPQYVEVALSTPSQRPSTASTVPSRGPTAQVSQSAGASSPGIRPVQQPVPGVATAQSDPAPEVKTDQTQAVATPSQAPIVASGSGQSDSNKTIIRGRDKRLYVVNT